MSTESRKRSDLEIIEAIESRRSVGVVKKDDVPREKIEQILESAVQAPNHRITEPWRFHVFSGRGRGELAKARAEWARLTAESDGEDEENIAGRVSRERKKAFRAPVVIAVVSKAGRDEVETLENYAACAAAVQNMQLAAHSLGLAAMWRTGPAAYHEHMRSFLGLEDGDQIVAYLYVGYPDAPETRRRRTPAGEMTVWREG